MVKVIRSSDSKVKIDGTGALKIPAGNDTDSSTLNLGSESGWIRYNTSNNTIEFYEPELFAISAENWQSLATKNDLLAVGDGFVKKTGDIMFNTLTVGSVVSGGLTLNFSNATNIGFIVNSSGSVSFVQNDSSTYTPNPTRFITLQSGIMYLGEVGGNGTTVTSAGRIAIRTNQVSDHSLVVSGTAQFTAIVTSGMIVKNHMNMSTYRITNVGDPVAAQDAATKFYVDSLANGISWKNAVRVATTGNISLTGLQSVDGISLLNGDRILVKNQANQAQNGIYVVSTGNWARSEDANNIPGNEIGGGTAVFVSEGTVNRDTAWTITSPQGAANLGIDLIVWTQFAGLGSIIAGDGLSAAGNIFSVNSSVVRTSGNQSIDGVKTFTSTITGSITGNAGTATALQNPRTIALTGGVTGTPTPFNGTANISIPITSVDASFITGTIPSGNIGTDVVRTSGNQTIDGVKTFTSVIAGSITGNAGTATALQTGRTIALTGGVTGTPTPFNGTANISIPITSVDANSLTGTINVGRLPSNVVLISGNQNIYDTKTFNGSTIIKSGYLEVNSWSGSEYGFLRFRETASPNIANIFFNKDTKNLSISVTEVSGSTSATSYYSFNAFHALDSNHSVVTRMGGDIRYARLSAENTFTEDQIIRKVTPEIYLTDTNTGSTGRLQIEGVAGKMYLQKLASNSNMIRDIEFLDTQFNFRVGVDVPVSAKTVAIIEDTNTIANTTKTVMTREKGDARYAQLSAQNTFTENQRISKSAPQFILNDTSSTNIARIVLQNISGVATNVYYQKLNSSLGLIRDIELDDTQFNFRVGAGSSARTVAIIEDTSSISNYSSTLMTREKGDARYLATGLITAENGQILFNTGVNSYEPDYSVYLGDFVDSNEELLEAQQGTVDQEELFSRWYRFTHINLGPVYPISNDPNNLQGEQIDWTYDTVAGLVRNTTNSTTVIGLVSLEKSDTYIIDSQIASTNVDDDIIGLVIAFTTEGIPGQPGYKEHVLSINRNAGGYSIAANVSAAVPGDRLYTLNYNYGLTGGVETNLTYLLPNKINYRNGSATNNQGWVTAGPGCRLKVERTGDNITVTTSELGTTTLNPVTSYTFSLTSNPLYEKFRGKTRYGFMSSSQANSSWDATIISNKIYSLYQNTTYSFNGTAWVNTGVAPNAEIGIGRIVSNPKTSKVFFVRGPNDYALMTNPYQVAQEQAQSINANNITSGTLNTLRLPSDVVKTSGNQTIDGIKTFNSTIIGSITGNAGTATALQTGRTISLTGGASGTATSFNGTANISIPVTSLDATTLTGIVNDARLSTNVMLLNNAQTVTGRKIFTASQLANGSILTATGGLGGLELQSSGSGVTAGGAFLTFHRPSSYALYLGLDTDNQITIGGWSAGAGMGNMKVGSLGVGQVASGVAGTITASSTITGQIFNIGLDTNNRFQQGALVLRGASPTVYLRDTDHNSGMIHVNSNIMYFLRGATDSETWSQVNGQWPLYINLTNNDATFGGGIFLPVGFIYESTNAAVTAAGTTQGTATQIGVSINNVTSVPAGSGIRLPTPSTGMKVVIFNNGAADLRIYPNTGHTIIGLTLNSPIIIGPGTSMTLYGMSTSTWAAQYAPYG